MSNVLMKELLEKEFGIAINPHVEVYIDDKTCTDKDYEWLNCVRENKCYMSDLRPSNEGDIIEVYYNQVKEYL